MNHTKTGSVLPLCGQHILGGSRAPLSYLLERDMHRHRFPFLAGEDTPQTTLSHPYEFQLAHRTEADPPSEIH